MQSPSDSVESSAHTHKYICISFHDFTTSHKRCLSDVSEVLLWRFLPSKPDKPVIVKAVKSLEDALEALEAVEAGSAHHSFSGVN